MSTATATPTIQYAPRLRRLRTKLAEEGWSGLLVLEPSDVVYLTGLRSSNAALVVTPEAVHVVTDFRYAEAAATVTGAVVHQLARNLYGELGRHVSEWIDGGTLAYSPSSLTHRAFLQLTEDLPSTVMLRAADGTVARLREVKDDAETELIRRASALLDVAYESIQRDGLTGRTELEVSWAIERGLREAGAEALSFESIVAGGTNGAKPHHHPADEPIPTDTLVTIDIGCVVGGYCSDCTRTFATGDPSDALREIYAVTLRAQRAAVEAVRPGISGEAVDAVARGIIDNAGYGEQFGHSLGHGVGLQVHEGPTLARTNDRALEIGNMVTVEPGIYVPELGGVRIEDLVVVTADGCEILTNYTKELIQL